MQCINQKLIWPHRSIDWLDAGNEEQPILVPCGKCIPCLTNKRADWTFRLQEEHKVSKSAHFVTLTYDEKHLRTSRSLCKRDVQLYLKRLRKKDETTRIRYYAVGEYGSKSGRPHYHILLFNSCEEHIRSSWTDSKCVSIGMVHVGKVAAASIAYVTKYMIQKDSYPDGMEKPFATMSRAYGIGGHYLSDSMVEWHRVDDRNYTVRPGNLMGRLPRFYREKIWYKEIDRQRVSAAAMKLTLRNQELEKQYYMNHCGDRWEAVLNKARQLVISRVKQKIQFSQTF